MEDNMGKMFYHRHFSVEESDNAFSERDTFFKCTFDKMPIIPGLSAKYTIDYSLCKGESIDISQIDSSESVFYQDCVFEDFDPNEFGLLYENCDFVHTVADFDCQRISDSERNYEGMIFKWCVFTFVPKSKNGRFTMINCSFDLEEIDVMTGEKR